MGDFNYGRLNKGAANPKSGAGHTVKSVALTSEYAQRFDLPSQWKYSIPVDRHHLDSLSSKLPDFWFRHVVKSLSFGNDNEAIAQSILSDFPLFPHEQECKGSHSNDRLIKRINLIVSFLQLDIRVP